MGSGASPNDSLCGSSHRCPARRSSDTAAIRAVCCVCVRVCVRRSAGPDAAPCHDHRARFTSFGRFLFSLPGVRFLFLFSTRRGSRRGNGALNGCTLGRRWNSPLCGFSPLAGYVGCCWGWNSLRRLNVSILLHSGIWKLPNMKPWRDINWTIDTIEISDARTLILK